MKLTELRSKIKYLLGDLTSTQYSDTNLDRATNDYYQKAIAIAARYMGQWEVNGEVATTNLIASQSEYPLPSDMLFIKRIEIDFSDGTRTWSLLDVMDMSEYYSALSNKTVEGASDWIRLFDNSLFLLNPPEDTVSSGVKIYYITEPTELSGDDDEPNLPEHCVSYLIHGASLDYSIRIKDEEMINVYRNLLLEDEHFIRAYYSNRVKTDKIKLKPRITNYE